MQVLSALTPPLLVCALVVIAVVAFLRHEIGRSRTDRTARRDQGDVPAVPRSADPDKRRSSLTDASRAAADDSGPAPRRLP